MKSEDCVLVAKTTYIIHLHSLRSAIVMNVLRTQGNQETSTCELVKFRPILTWEKVHLCAASRRVEIEEIVTTRSLQRNKVHTTVEEVSY